jgi:hypothetical protein
MILQQIFNAINLGLIILDRDLKIQEWNRWMDVHSGRTADSVKNICILEHTCPKQVC